MNRHQELVEHVWDWYQPGGLYGETFLNCLEKDDVELAVKAIPILLPELDLDMFYGSSQGREMVRDWMLQFDTTYKERASK